MSRGLVLALTIILAATGNAAVQTSAEPRLVDELDTIALTIRVTGQPGTGKPDLSPLESDFEILRSNSESQFRARNGRVESWVKYQISLRPRRAGELLIPSIDVNGEASQPIAVVVRPLDSQTKQAVERMVFFRTQVTPNRVYVQAQAVLTRHLYYSTGVQIFSDLPGMPEAANAVVIPVGDTRTGTTTLGGERYGVVEQRFAIFPEQSGELHIPEASITASVRLPSAAGGRSRRSAIRVRAAEQTISVLPIPQDYPSNQPWLPARNVRIDDAWSPGPEELTVGTPVQRRLRVIASGNAGSAIPPLDVTYPDSHFRWYPDPPIIDDREHEEQLTGERLESYSLIPVQPGSTRLPDVALTWWDTSSHRVRVARLPERQLLIGGSLPPVQPPPDGSAADSKSPQTAPETVATAAAAQRSHRALLPWAAGAAALVALYLVFHYRRSPRAPNARDLTPSASTGSWSEVKRACRNGDPAAMRHAVLALTQTVHGTTVAQAQALLRELDDAGTWQRLNRTLYGRDPRPGVTGQEVMRLAAMVHKPCAGPRDAPLPGLYDLINPRPGS